jgi:hypothetical protein
MPYSDFEGKNNNSEKIKELEHAFIEALDEFKKYYIFYHKNPDYREYQTNFENAQSNLNNVLSQMFKLTSNIQFSTSDMNKKIKELNIKIEEEKIVYKKLTSHVTHLNETYKASDMMINDFVTIYNTYYFKNVVMILGILAQIIILSKVFSSNVVSA